MKLRPRTRSRPSPGRFLVFLLVVAAALTYVAVQWQASHRAPGSPAAPGGAGSASVTGAARAGTPNAPGAGAPSSETGVGAAGTTSALASGVAAAPVAGSPAATFAAERLDLQQANSREAAVLQRISTDTEATPAVRQQAQKQLLDLVQREDREVRAETLLRARGYPDALVFLGPQRSVVVVHAAALHATDAARIADAVGSLTGQPPQQISIVARP